MNSVKKVRGEEVFPTRRQEAWGWPTVFAFTLAGMGGGLYISSSLLRFLTEGVAGFFSVAIPHGGLACVVTISGSFFLLLEAGRAGRARYVFSNLKQAGISKENLWLIVFLAGAISEQFLSWWGLRILTFLGALALILSQGLILYRSAGVTGWRNPMIPILVAASSLSSGWGILLLTSNVQGGFHWEEAVLAATVTLGANLAAWLIFLFYCNASDFRIATEKLRTSSAVFINVVIGQILPFCLLLGMLIFSENGVFGYVRGFSQVSAMMLMLSGLIQKICIVLLAGYAGAIVLNGKRGKNHGYVG